MGWTLRLSLAALLVSAAAQAGQASDWPQSKVAKVDLLAGKLLHPADTQRIAPPALSLAIGVDGEIVMAKGYGEAQPGFPATESTLYHIGSLTKQFTASAVLDLIDRKAVAPRGSAALTLDTEAGAIFDGVEHWRTSASDAVTVRRLLNMTSNLPNFTRRPPAASDPWGSIAAPALLSELKRLVPWGWPDSFEYSNTSYFLLAEMMEQVVVPGESGQQRYRDRLRSTLFSRASMTATGFIGEYPPGVVVAQATYRRKPVFALPDWLKGSGDMASNAVDLHRWTTALMEGRILAPAQRDLMFSDSARVGPTEWYGMGWFIEHKPQRDVFWHSGTVPGFTSYSMVARSSASPRWVSVILLTNSDGVTGLGELAEEIADIALE